MAVDLRQYGIGQWFTTREGGIAEFHNITKASIDYPYVMQYYNGDGSKGLLFRVSLDGMLCTAKESKFDIMEILTDNEEFDSEMMAEVNKVSTEKIRLGFALDIAIEMVVKFNGAGRCLKCEDKNKCSLTDESMRLCLKRELMEKAENKVEGMMR